LSFVELSGNLAPIVKMLSTITILLSAAGAAYAQGAAWAQCGGIGFSGATTCVSGYVCTVSKFAASPFLSLTLTI